MFSVEFLLEALMDTAKLLPFLIAVYFLVSFLEYRLGSRMNHLVVSSFRFAPILGALLGCFPQCGFSVVAATLYTKNLISVGTLLAVFISTSDEAVPVLLAMPDQIGVVGKLLLLKVFVAIVVGIVVDRVLRRKAGPFVINEEDIASAERHQGCCAHEVCAARNRWRALLWHPLQHAFKIALLLFILSVMLGAVLEAFGEGRLYGILLGSIFQPALAALIGLVPNCFASVFLAELYAKGVLTFSALFAGLSAGAGLGLLVLFKENKSLKDSFLILGLLVFFSVLAGMIFLSLGF